jgi:hypothetical protein
LLDFGTQNDGLNNLCQRPPLLLMLALYSQMSFMLAHSLFSLPIARAALDGLPCFELQQKLRIFVLDPGYRKISSQQMGDTG